ncbi:hypothetical protein ABK040_007867 [Willaertia magna]
MLTLFSKLCEAISKGTRTLTGDYIKTMNMIKQIKNEIQMYSELLLEKDKELKLLLNELIENQKIQQQIRKTQFIIEEKEYKLSKLSESLQEVHSNLNFTLHDSIPIVKSIKQSKKLNLQDVISYAQFINRTTNELPSLENTGLQGPPFPAPEVWNLSLLHLQRLRLYKQQLIEEKMKTENLTMESEKLPKINFDRLLYEEQETTSGKLNLFDNEENSEKVPEKLSIFDEDSDSSDEE